MKILNHLNKKSFLHVGTERGPIDVELLLPEPEGSGGSVICQDRLILWEGEKRD